METVSQVLKDEEERSEGQSTGAAILNEISEVFVRFIVLPSGAADALALWTLFSHVHEAFEISPYLVLKSAVKRSGKTNTLILLNALVSNPELSSNTSAAGIFRTIRASQHLITLILDEGDSFIGGREDMRGILNSGHTRDTAFVIRCNPPTFKPERFSTWCAKAIAGIGDLPATLEDRSIVINMQRKEPGQGVPRLRRKKIRVELEPLKARAAIWATANMGPLMEMNPELPDGLNDRQADNWEPLLAIADLCGDRWPEMARRSAVIVSGSATEADMEIGIRLLCDLKAIYDAKGGQTALSTSDVIEGLKGCADGRWADLDAFRLSRLLRPFGVKPRQCWIGGSNRGGYSASDLAESFRRYAPNRLDPRNAAPANPHQ